MENQGDHNPGKISQIGLLLLGVAAVVLLPFFLGNRDRFTGEIWRYHNQETNQEYLLLSNVSTKSNAIFGPTKKIRRSNIIDVENHISGGRYYDVYIKDMGSLTVPEDKEYCLVTVDEMLRGVKLADERNTLDDIIVKSIDGLEVTVDRKLLHALVNDYREPKHGKPILGVLKEEVPAEKIAQAEQQETEKEKVVS